jgi:hypothetical protein
MLNRRKLTTRGYVLTAATGFASALLLAILAPVNSAKAAATISQGYYQESALKSCPNAATCTVLFSAIPALKTVIVQHVGCIMQIGGTLPLLSMTLSSKLGGVSTQRSNYLTPTLMGTASNVRNYNVNNDVLDIMNAGEIPQISFNLSATGTTFVANCSISGQIKP